VRDRGLLGAADVTDAVLTELVATQLGCPPREVVVTDCWVEVFPYDIPALTTVGRWRVAGTARTARGDEGFSLFVKHVQSWVHSPFFSMVPEHLREAAAASYPWRIERAVYESDLRDRLPGGLSMPRALAVNDLPDEAYVLWLEEVSTRPVVWDVARFTEAARLLGRLAASQRVAPVSRVGGYDGTVSSYVHGRLEHQVLPILRSDDVWACPHAAAFDPQLRARLLDAADRFRELGAELASYPLLTAHGDACPNNLLAPDGRPGFVLIDFGLFTPLPVGFDLGQLLVGDTQIGRRPAAALPEIEAAIVPAYVAGLREEGCDLAGRTVRRAHALQLLLFSGLSAVPFEQFDQPLTPELEALAADRAAIARLSLDLVDATSG
jgi:hypothetical protein